MLDRAILTRILPGTIAENRAQLGIYGANYKLAMLITLFTQAYRYAAEPFFFRHAAEKNALELQAQVTRWFTIVAAGAVLFILLYLDIIKYFLGVKYHDGLTVVPILLTANMLLGIYYNFSIWYRLKDRTMTGAWIALSSAILTLVLLLWWVPQYGYEGAAWATLFCYLYLSIATWFAGRKIYPVPYALGKMAFYLVTPLLLYGIAEFLRPMTQDNQILFWSIRSLLFLGFAAFVWKWEEVKSEF
jgi:O-antigen/teichoic acid export membrane protein